MNKQTKFILVGISIVMVIAIVFGTIYAVSPANDTKLEITSVTTELGNELGISLNSQGGIVNVVLTCKGNESGNINRFRKNFAYINKVEFKNMANNESMHQMSMQNKWQHKVESGSNTLFQFQLQGMKLGQIIQLQIHYNNGQLFQHNFSVAS